MKKLLLFSMLLALGLSFSGCGDDDEPSPPFIWRGANTTFTKAENADWTLPANQDRITAKVVLTRQDQRPLYNYQWWQDNFGKDAENDWLLQDFWDDTPDTTFTPTGGTKGIKWAIIDTTDTGWDADFDLIGTLGDSTHFYSFNNIASIARYMDRGDNITEVVDDFTIRLESGNTRTGTSFPTLVGKKLGAWIVDEDIYFSITFTEWGSNGSGGSVSYTRSTR